MKKLRLGWLCLCLVLLTLPVLAMPWSGASGGDSGDEPVPFPALTAPEGGLNAGFASSSRTGCAIASPSGSPWCG